MMTFRLRLLFALVVAVALPLSGCLFRSRKASVLMSTAQLQSATFQELVDKINHGAAQVQTLNATVDIAASTGGSKKGKVTDFQEIKGYILVRKPEMLRMIGLFPIVRNRAFDMVSNGDIRIDGALVGNLTAKAKILIGPEGSVDGDIEGMTADVLGKVTGKIKVKELLFLRGKATLNGDIYAGKLQIEPTATFNGQCHMGANIVELNTERASAVNL